MLIPPFNVEIFPSALSSHTTLIYVLALGSVTIVLYKYFNLYVFDSRLEEKYI
jgi:hypothetical protein